MISTVGSSPSPAADLSDSRDSPIPSEVPAWREASSSKKLSAEARPWYPTRVSSVSSQPFQEDEFPSAPFLATMEGLETASPVGSTRSMSTRRRENTPPYQTDYEDDTVVYRIQLRDDEALTEEQVIRELVDRGDVLTDGRNGFWGSDAPYAEGLHHVRTEHRDGEEGGEEEDFADWEDDSDAYTESLDEDQIQWIEEQLRARSNPDDFFF